MPFVLIGLVAGVLSGFFGIGGGVVIIPALLLIIRMQPATATGTSLAALVLPVGAYAAWEYYKKGHLDLSAALLLALGLFLGAAVGAHFALRISSRHLQQTFAVFLVFVAVQLWWRA